MSNTERVVANLAVVESIQELAIIFQKFALDEVETSQFFSEEESVKYFTNERNK